MLKKVVGWRAPLPARSAYLVRMGLRIGNDKFPAGRERFRIFEVAAPARGGCTA
jgi:hypothetical protein